MRKTLPCSACGTVLGLPKKGIPADGLTCNWCGYVNHPAPEPAAAPTAPVSTPPPAAFPVPFAPSPADDPDTSDPYRLPEEEAKTRPCASCGKKIDILAVLCHHCGFDAESGRKIERTYEPVNYQWVAGWPVGLRWSVFGAFQVLNVLTVIASLSITHSLPGSVTAMLFSLVLQAFLVGTYDTLHIRRNRKGQADITITWRVAFVPLAARKVNWRENEGVAFGHYYATSIVDWLLFFLLLPGCLIPALVFFFYVIRSDRYYAALTRDHNYPETYLYRGMSEKQAKEICQVATDVTGLPLATPL